MQNIRSQRNKVNHGNHSKNRIKGEIKFGTKKYNTKKKKEQQRQVHIKCKGNKKKEWLLAVGASRGGGGNMSTIPFYLWNDIILCPTKHQDQDQLAPLLTAWIDDWHAGPYEMYDQSLDTMIRVL